jgi:hypothetical protein
LRIKNGRRLLSKSELTAAECSDTRDLEMLGEAERDVWEGPGDVKAKGLPTARRRGALKPSRGRVVGLLIAGLGGLGCGGAQGAGGTPEATLAEASDAQVAFRPLLKRWVRGSTAERAKLEVELYAFAKQHRRDPLERLTEAMLAWIALERGDLPRADTLARRVVRGPPGNTRNIALVVVGAELRRSGDPRAALQVLRPLVSKLIDPWARALLNDEAVASALAARDWAEAIRFMELAVREAGDEDRLAAREAVTARVAAIPDEELISLLEHRHGGWRSWSSNERTFHWPVASSPSPARSSATRATPWPSSRRAGAPPGWTRARSACSCRSATRSRGVAGPRSWQGSPPASASRARGRGWRRGRTEPRGTPPRRSTASRRTERR